MKNILVIGADGMLGYAVTKYFEFMQYKVCPLTRKDFDITKGNISDLGGFINSSDVVINCAGVINKVVPSTPIEDVLKVNTIFPINLANICNFYETPCLHITTDCCYSGKKGMYTESDYFDAQDVYGLSKVGGDLANCMVLRTSIIGEEKNNFRSLLSWLQSKKGQSVKGYTNHYWNGLTTLYLAEVIDDIMSHNLYEKGIFHIFSSKIISKYDLLVSLNNLYDLNIDIKALETEKEINRSLSTEKSLCKNVVKKELDQQIMEMRDFFIEVK